MVKKTLLVLSLLAVCSGTHSSWGQETSTPQVTVPSIDPTAQEVLTKMGQLYQGMTSFHHTTMGTVSIQSQAFSKDTSTKTEVWMQRPNLFQIKVQQGVKSLEIISDGSDSFFFVPALNAYMSRPAPINLEEMALKYVSKLAPQGGDGRFDFFYMTSDPYASLVMGASRVEMIGVENVDGTDCHHLRIHRRPVNVDLWFQTGGQPLIRKVAPDSAALETNMSKRLPGVKIDMHVVYSGWEVNPALATETFRFTPPEGAEEKTSFADMNRPKDPKELIGKDAPDLRAQLLSGGEFNLADHKGKNVIIMDFWATWCGPCVYGLPILSEVANEYKDKGVVFVAVNQGDEPQVIQAFMEKKQLSFPVGLDQSGERGMKYYVSGIPQTVLIGKDGKVASVHVGMALNLKDMLKQELDTLLSGGTLPSVAGPAPGSSPPEASAPSPSSPPR